jgi:hypothetical protein
MALNRGLGLEYLFMPQRTLKGGLARFTRNMGMLIGGGVPMFDALRLVTETSDNLVIKDAVANVRTSVGDGKLFSQAIAADAVFPALMAEMIGVGEETGTLESHLLKVSAYYEDEAERAGLVHDGPANAAIMPGILCNCAADCCSVMGQSLASGEDMRAIYAPSRFQPVLDQEK